MGDTTSRSYESVAWFYELLAHVFSLGLIRAAKASQVPHLSKGDRILYVGAGSGEDAILAARAGAKVTCVDLSPAMLSRIKKRFAKEDLDAEFICSDVIEFRPDVLFDAGAANFFLNIFPEPVMKRVLQHLTQCVKPGGKILIADFATSGGAIATTVSKLYYLVALVFFWALRLMPLHPIYDYRSYLKEVGAELSESKDFRLCGIGPCVYRSLVAVRRPE
ncbi:MAG: methyltransferase domain-containing protein [Candidatus Hydrogenedentes bacterium]|nr:methyltransferase domain-containing protein [Candidatus Hydrogenedentota bacterium]